MTIARKTCTFASSVEVSTSVYLTSGCLLNSNFYTPSCLLHLTSQLEGVHFLKCLALT